MAEQDGKQRMAKSPTAPVSGRDGTQLKRQPASSTPPEHDNLAGLQTNTICLFIKRLEQLPKTGSRSGSSVNAGGNTGSSSKK